MFSFAGGTEEFGVMAKEIMAMYPASLFIAVGFSMGGNVVTKFMGEHPAKQHRFLGAISCCQGYDINE